MKSLLFVCLLLVFPGWNIVSPDGVCAAGDYAEIQVVDGGSVVGNVKLGGYSTALSLDLSGGMELRKFPRATSEKIVISGMNNGIKSAVVSIKDIPKGKKRIVPEIRPIIDHQKNSFIPRITSVIKGTTVDILNGDESMHTVHSQSVKNQPFNHGMTFKQRLSKVFVAPEIVKISCDIHKGAYAWIVVQDNPYFDVTDRNGYFEICDIPAGSYTFQVWHEELGNLEKEVTIDSNKITTIEFVYDRD
ncbi:MAG: hypothetical protein MRJ65_16055 [Candidatus Brocadiaceae bacterium]|nr:hypothetical protein [Candidatus Brocadiaceae bacterium]